MASFWGDPQFKPNNEEVARFLGVIRDLTENQTDARALRTATSSLHAIAYFVAQRISPKEALALLDHLKDELMGMVQ